MTKAQNEDLSGYVKCLIDSMRVKQPLLRQNSARFDKVTIDTVEEKVDVYLTKGFSAIPIRDSLIQNFTDSIKERLSDNQQNYKINIHIGSKTAEYYVPNFYRSADSIDKGRLQDQNEDIIPLVKNISKPYVISHGLANRHFALWNSHGIYFDPSINSWTWQRPRLFTITEDTYTSSIMLPFLLPMIENAGGYPLLARERDIQNNEVIVDYDNHQGNSSVNIVNSAKTFWSSDSCGFGDTQTIYKEGSSFGSGTYHKIRGRKVPRAYIEWIPNIPETGNYAVYVTYKSLPQSATDAHYIVYHDNDSTEFYVNQKMGGDMWVYLGTFKFEKGKNHKTNKVVLRNNTKDRGSIITADAVRFGGGMGNIARCDNDSIVSDSVSYDTLFKISGMPRYLEGARYYLQYSGFADSVYSPNNGKNEYKDDLMSRALWVNNLCGGSTLSPNSVGKNIPIDLTLALHTDAGISSDIIGSLGIYMTNGHSNYPDGQERIASRDLTDLVQTETVNDINHYYKNNWSRRKLTDESYYEARVPEVPTMLFELLSHQNYNDMSYALDPHFRFIVARAIYKGILKYLYSQSNKDYVVEPLPVHNFGCHFVNYPDTTIHLSWEETVDSLESTAKPDDYILYTAIDSSDFDNGTIIEGTHVDLNINYNKIYRFKVAAINAGGESFPSEELAVSRVRDESGKVLIVNGFSRVASPKHFENEDYSGFYDEYDTTDVGVPYLYDISYTGRQYDFRKNSEFVDNENPGCGASKGDYENLVIAGNTFNYPYVHGKSMVKNKLSFVSTSAEHFATGSYSNDSYTFIDYILGKQKTEFGDSLFTQNEINTLSEYLNNNGNLLISGEYIANNYRTDTCDSITNDFIMKYLHISTNFDSITERNSVIFDKNLSQPKVISYYNSLNKDVYSITKPSILVPTDSCTTILSYDSTYEPICVAYKQDYCVVTSSLPIEVIKEQTDRNQIIKYFYDFFVSEDKKKMVFAEHSAKHKEHIPNLINVLRQQKK